MNRGAAYVSAAISLLLEELMGYFYLDESIQARAGFIIGAFVYSGHDLTPSVYSALEQCGLKSGVDEFKSGAHMTLNPEQKQLRELLSSLLINIKVGVVVVPMDQRQTLGTEALHCLEKILETNNLNNYRHQVFFDENITVGADIKDSFLSGLGAQCQLHLSQDSKIVGGIQLADLVAHSLGVMLLEQMGLLTKKVRVGENSGYDPDLEVELGFELWASLRYCFFKAPQPKLGPIPDDPVGELMFDVENYGLHIASTCMAELRDAALGRFGECYLGCIH